MRAKLTIAYVTYNRKYLITKRIIEILKNSIPSDIEILIIDDNSLDGTFKKIERLTKKTKIKILKNKKNLGFSGNYIKAILKAKGQYVIWTSDKDGVLFSNISRILSWIYKIKPDVAILNYTRKLKTKKNDIKYIRNNKTRKIDVDELWKCSHGPGIIWRRDIVKKIIKNWKNFEKKYPTFAKYYPNLFLIINLMPLRNSYFFNGEITYQASYPKFSFFLEKEKSYNFLVSRWLQHKELLNFLIFCARQKKYKNYYNRMINSINLNLHSFISTSLREERPDLYYYWWRGVYSPLLLIERIFKLMKFVIFSFFHDPAWTILKIKNKLNLIYKKQF